MLSTLLLLLLISTARILAQSLSTLIIDWSHGPLANNIGTVNNGAIVDVVWNVFEDPDNLTLSVLLKQDLSAGSPIVIAVLAADDVPNNGSFLWRVEDSIQPGGNYYIRLQTGNADDWDGGTSSVPSTPGGVYGLAGIFAIASQASSTSLPDATTFVSDISSSSIFSTSSTSTTSAPFSSSPTTPPITPFSSSASPASSTSPTDATTFVSDISSSSIFSTTTTTTTFAPFSSSPTTLPITPLSPSASPVSSTSPTDATTFVSDISSSSIFSTSTTTTTASAPFSNSPTTPPITHLSPSASPVSSTSPTDATTFVSDISSSSIFSTSTTTTTTSAPFSGSPATPPITPLSLSAPPPTTTTSPTPTSFPTTETLFPTTGSPSTTVIRSSLTTAIPSPTTETPSPATPIPSTTTETPSPTTAIAPLTTEDPSPTTAISPLTTDPSPTTAIPPPSTVIPSPSTETPSPTAIPPPTTEIPSPTTGTPSPTAIPPTTETPSPTTIPSPPTTTPSPTASGTQILTALPVEWSSSGLNRDLGLIIAGTDVNITWDASQNSDNVPLSVLLKQGTGSEGGRVVSVPAPENVPNRGSFIWHVNNSLPPGDDYYIRLQTGSSDDWNGGLNTSLPTPGAIYGLTGYFTINSTFSGSAASAVVVATHFVTCCTPAKSNSGNAGKIAGSVIGAVIGLAFLTALGFALTKKKPPQPSADGTGNRNFFFNLTPALLRSHSDRLDPAQLTLILKPEGVSDVRLIAWQVFNIDGRNDSFKAVLPPDQGFGDVRIDEDRDAIAGITYASSERFTFAPPGWQVSLEYYEGELSFSEPLDLSKKCPNHILIKNGTEVPHGIIIGSYHKEDDKEIFQPFVMLEGIKDKFVAPHALRLQIYLTSGVEVGQVVSDSLLDSPLLRPVGGIKVANLKPGSTTTWEVDEGANGMPSLRLA